MDKPMISIKELTDAELDKQIRNARTDIDEAEYGSGDYNTAFAELMVAEQEKQRRERMTSH